MDLLDYENLICDSNNLLPVAHGSKIVKAKSVMFHLQKKISSLAKIYAALK